MANEKTKTIIAIIAVILTYTYWAFYLGSYSQRVIDTLHPKTDTIFVEKSLTDFQTLEMAIILTESNFNANAEGENKDYGLLQITPIYVDEVNRILGENKYTHQDAFDISKALEMFRIMQNYHNPTQDKEKAIKLHNKAPWYEKRVNKNIQVIQTYEYIRTQL